MACRPHGLLPAAGWAQVMEPVRSRCLCVRVAAPSDAQVLDALSTVACKEGLTLPPPFAARVVSLANRNLRRWVGGAGWLVGWLGEWLGRRLHGALTRAVQHARANCAHEPAACVPAMSKSHAITPYALAC